MKNLVRVVAMGFAVAASASVAQAQTGVSLGLGGGAAVPTGSLADGAKTGWSSEVVARVKPAASPVGLQLDGFYNRFGLQGGIDGNARLLGGTANAVLAFPISGPAHPYLIGGVGVYNGKTTITGQPTTDSQTKFGANGGLGLDVGIGKSAAFFAEGRFHAIFKGAVDQTTLQDETAYMIPVTLGMRWTL
jgi:opacity protein-like surface antigen